MEIWSVLGIEPTQDITVIKRAYALQLKKTRPDQDPDAYQQLREAFESARRGEYFWAESDIVTCPLPLMALTDESLIRQMQVHALVCDAVTLLLSNEQAGVVQLFACLSDDLLQNLQMREMFSQQLAWDLAEREGLTPSVLEQVAAMMEWEIDHYQPVGISIYQLQALYQQIEKTTGRRYQADSGMLWSDD
ncbi:molecular chaperone DnaJ [Enterobacteriaceae bacterium ML5]|nr:molecular chaperone DnaJ [Enterobacteriaceae bacterium ML5]